MKFRHLTGVVFVPVILLLLRSLVVVVTAPRRKSATTTGTGGGSGGVLTLKTYKNSALAGPPSKISSVRVESETPFLSIGFDHTTTQKEYSAELIGTISLPRPAAKTALLYHFNCSFSQSVMGWVWVDGHVVCGENRSTYQLVEGLYDNPLPVSNGFGADGGAYYPRRTTVPFRAHIMLDTTTTVFAKKEGRENTTSGISSFPFPQLNISWSTPSPPSSGERISFPASTLRSSELKRDLLQRKLASGGWGNFLHRNMNTIVKLPEGLGVTPQICRRRRPGSGARDEDDIENCIVVAIPDGISRFSQVQTRVGVHAWDRSYVQTYIGPFVDTTRNLSVPVNVSIEYTAFGPDNRDIHLLVTPISCDGDDGDRNDCSDYEVRIRGEYFWLRSGSASVHQDSLQFDSPGFGKLVLFGLNNDNRQRANGSSSDSAPYTCAEEDCGDDVIVLGLSVACRAVGFSSLANTTVAQVESALSIAREQERSRMVQRFGSKSDVMTAVQAAVMWVWIYTPIENSGPILPVARSWKGPGQSPDFSYVMFEWDNFFASLLAGIESCNKDMVYSNLFQVVKSKTAAGFIPNFSAGGIKTEDRTEPPVGARVVLELYRKFREKWMVDVVFDDLLDWNDWFIRRRLLPPLGLVSIGTWNEQAEWAGVADHSDTANAPMQGARFESGLDNSPMYDGHLFNNETHLMELYDVGMSSLFISEAYALAELANVIGRPPELSAMLRSRGDDMAAKMRQHLWDPQQQIYANKFRNGSFSRRITPTSFYPMLAKAALDDQVVKMVEGWLLNSSRFCISPNGDFEGNTNECYWGLPSVSPSS